MSERCKECHRTLTDGLAVNATLYKINSEPNKVEMHKTGFETWYCHECFVDMLGD